MVFVVDRDCYGYAIIGMLVKRVGMNGVASLFGFLLSSFVVMIFVVIGASSTSWWKCLVV